MNFSQLGLSSQTLKAVEKMGFTEVSPIQEKTIGPMMEGHDIIGQAQTGTGKTAAFAIPILERIENSGPVEALVLVPTRELSLQVANEFRRLSGNRKKINILPVYGGADMRRQLKELAKGVQIVVGTPGRVMDHLRRGSLDLMSIKTLVLDEADEMFDMGFREDMKTIINETAPDRQTCFFSATIDKEIEEFSRFYQKDPIDLAVKTKTLTVDKVDQYYLELKSSMKAEVLARLIDIYDPSLSMVFCNTKKMVDDLVSDLTKRGYNADGLHGDLKQVQRDVVMKKFRDRTIDILVATDVAARGIDVGAVEAVFNYDLPAEEEYYVHRIGRTARAGRRGLAMTFVTERDAFKLSEITKYTKQEIEKMDLPTLYDVKLSYEERLTKRVLEKASQDDSHYEKILDRLLSEGHDLRTLTLATLAIADKSMGRKDHEELDRVDFGKKFSFVPDKVRDKKRAGRKGTKNKGTGVIFIDKGKKDRLDVQTVIAFVKRYAGIDPKQIGDISIKASFTFVELPDDKIMKAVKKLEGKKMKGKKVRVEVSNRS